MRLQKASQELRSRFKKRAMIGIIIELIGVAFFIVSLVKGSTSGLELGIGAIALGIGFVLFAQASLSMWE